MKKFLLVALLISSCSGYRTPICNEKNRVDVPNLEGKFSIHAAILQDDESTVLRQEFNFSRLARGIYLSQSQQASEFSACEIEGQIYIESNTIVASSPGYYSAFKLNRNGDGSFDLVMLGIDTRLLKAKGIPYEIVENKKNPGIRSDDDCKSSDGKTECKVTKTVVIDNTKLSGEELTQILDPLSFQIKLAPEPMRVSLLKKP